MVVSTVRRKKMSRKASVMVILLCISLGAGLNLYAGGGQEKAPASLTEAVKIDWNSPIPWAERLAADKYILPKGWEKATVGVKSITFGNAGALMSDIATKMNMIRFEELTGIKVNAIELPADLMIPKTLATVVARNPNVHLAYAGATDNLGTLMAGKWLEPIDFFWPQAVMDLYGSSVRDYRIDGHWWGSFITTVAYSVYYRPSWLKSAGVEVPRSWAELYPAVRKIDAWAKQQFGKDYYGIVFPGDGLQLTKLLQDIVHSQGKRVFAEGKYDFDLPEFENAFYYLLRFAKEGMITPDFISYDYSEPPNLFGLGKAGFCVHAATAYSMKFPTEYLEIKDDWEMMPQFKWENSSPDSYQTGDVGHNGLAVPTYIDNNHKAAALLFMDYVRSREATRNELCVEGNESAFVANYEDNDAARKVDWNLADRAAKELGIPNPSHVSELTKSGARGTVVKYGYSEPAYPGYENIMKKVNELFAKAVSGELSKEEAVKGIISYVKSFY
jgi:ABC-type glycerol-3-phosphate transport system substrate-binding protein